MKYNELCGFYENVSFYFSSDNITTIEISPSGPITLDENAYFYFRNEQGNALKLTEDQYLRFAEEKSKCG